LRLLLAGNAPDKVEKVLDIFRDCKVDEWALRLKNKFLDEALAHLEDIAVLSKRKQPLIELAQHLMQREN
jgi:geranylgeranyl diphosphate synthase, type II